MKIICTAVIIALFFSAGCGPTSMITSSWKAQDIQPKKYNKIVVVGLVREEDRSMREKMEMHMVGDLKDLGYDAVCSCDEYNPKAFETLTEQQAIDKLKNSGVDAVITVVLLNKTKEKYYVPGNITYSPYAIYHNQFWGYYRTMSGRIYTEGYYVPVIDTKYFWETNFYDLTADQLLYSAQSQSFAPASAETLGHEYGQLIVKDMVKNNLLKDLKKEIILKAM
jgi:hypothetical protein